jgi:Ca-activated chloride channel family protein
MGLSTGLIVYSGSAHLVMPLTRDDRIVNAMLEDLTPELMPVDGDALIDALKLARRVLQRAGVPGSVLVMADSVATAQEDAIDTELSSLPIQFLAISTPVAPLDMGLERVASVLSAPVLRLSVDEADVQRAAQRAHSDFKSVAGDASGDRWRDAGYFLLPLIALLALIWTRPGWLVR